VMLFLASARTADLSLNIFDDYCKGFLIPRTVVEDSTDWIFLVDGAYTLEFKGKVDTDVQTNVVYTLDQNNITINTQNIRVIVEETDAEETIPRPKVDYLDYQHSYLFPFVNEDDHTVYLALPFIKGGSSSASDKSLLITEFVGKLNNMLNGKDSDGVFVGKAGLLFVNSNGGSEFVFPILKDSLDTSIEFFNDFTESTDFIGSPDNFTNGNCLVDQEASVYFINTFSYNWALWVFVFITLGYFLVSVFFNNTIASNNIEESNWTLHPFVSVATRGSEIFTKKSRFAQLALEFSPIVFLSALLTSEYEDSSVIIRVLVFPLCGIVFGSIISYITGILINLNYTTHKTYISDIKDAESAQDRKRALDKYEKSRFQTFYLYYIFFFIFTTPFLVVSMYFMHNKRLNVQAYWTLGLVIAAVLEYCVFYIIVVFLAKSEGLKKLFKMKGYYYEKQVHVDYFEILGLKFE
jgi:hypothetical protein